MNNRKIFMKNITGWWMAALVLLLCGTGLQAVETNFVTHETETQFKDGEPNNVLISSRGELALGFQAQKLLKDIGQTWVVNDIAQTPDGAIYVATSGAGYIYRIRDGKNPEVIFGKDQKAIRHVFSLAVDRDGRLLAGASGEKAQLLRLTADGKSEILWKGQDIVYIWNIQVASDGTLYLATGPDGEILSMDAKGQNVKVVYKAKEKNILALALARDGQTLFAGGDEYGLIYKIDLETKKTTIAYDTQHAEISAMVFDERGNLYVSTADASAARPGAKLILSEGKEGRAEKETPAQGEPQKEEPKSSEEKPSEKNGKSDSKDPNAPAAPGKTGEKETPQTENGKNSEKTAPKTESAKTEPAKTGSGNADKKPDAVSPAGTSAQVATPAQAAPTTPRPTAMPGSAGPSGGARPRSGGNTNEVFKITPKGYVVSLFNKPVVILDMAYADSGELLLATGTEGRVIHLDVETREAVIIYDAKPAAQVSAILKTANGPFYAGLANPAGLVAVEADFAREGYYVSPPIDADQVSLWGQVRLEADIPFGASLKFATRTGNTSEPRKGGWQDWTEPVDAREALAVKSEPGRFLQYKLIFGSQDGEKTALVRRVKIASLTPNLPPRVESFEMTPMAAPGAGGMVGASMPRPAGMPGQPSEGTPGPQPVMQLKWTATDANKDTMKYEVFLRPLNGAPWLRIGKDLDQPLLRWDSRTVADGRYEFRVVASDAPSNPEGLEQTGARVSKPLLVDNTPPEIANVQTRLENKRLRVTAVLEDALSPIAEARYNLDSAEDWRVVLAADRIFDSQREELDFEVKVEDAGPHLLSVQVKDAQGNSVYKNVQLK